MNNEHVITEQLRTRREKGCSRLRDEWEKESRCAMPRDAKWEPRHANFSNETSSSVFICLERRESFAAKWISNEFTNLHPSSRLCLTERAPRSFNIWHSLCEQHLYLLLHINLWHFSWLPSFFLVPSLSHLLLCDDTRDEKGNVIRKI